MDSIDNACVNSAAAACRGKNFGLKMDNALKSRFPPFRDERSLRSAIESVCAEFGTVASLIILPADRAVGLQCTCLLRLDNSEAENRLRSKFSLIDFGTDLLFFVEVDEEWTGRTMRTPTAGA